MEVLHFFQSNWAIVVFIGTVILTWGQTLQTLRAQREKIKEYADKVETVEKGQSTILIALTEMRAEVKGELGGLRRDVDRIINPRK